MKGPRRARSGLGDAEQRLEKKKRREKAQRNDGIPNGLVEIPGPFPEHVGTEIRNIVDRTLARERERDEHARVVAITPFREGLAIETESEKLAQHIADALGRSRKADVTRKYDDAGRRRILTCRLPGIGRS